jgi:serine protease Do
MKRLGHNESKGPVIFLLVFFLGIFLGGAAEGSFWTQTTVQKAPGDVPITNETIANLAEKMKASVVNINTTMVMKRSGPMQFQPPFGERDPFRDFWEKFFGGQMPQEYRARSLGSGVLVNKEGYIITNSHVIQNAEKIVVTLHNKKDYQAKIVGGDQKTDLALIKIDAKEDLPVAPLGDSDQLKVGEWVIAVGNPFGLAETVTAGIVSAKGRVIGAGPYDDFIQTDASINPGNSGGPLFNVYGEVVGINTAIVATGQGIGFAIPINLAKEIVLQLKEKGRVVRGWLGVSIQRVTSDLAESFGLKEAKGALVSKVFENSPAEQAGLKQGDVIVQFDGREIESSMELPRIVASTPVGKEVTIQFFRDGKTMSVKAKITEMAGEEKKEAEKEGPPQKPIGILVQDVTPQIAASLGMEKATGIIVVQVEPGGPADEAGMHRGDVILEVNRKPIGNAKDFARALEEDKNQTSLLILIRRGEGNIYLTVKPR